MRITKVTYHRFKKYRDTEISIESGVSLLAGGNSSGKTSILQGLAVWEFCRTVLETERGKKSLCTGHSNQGVGLGYEDFSALNVPSLKHLWTNLRTQKDDESDGYTLWIQVDWLSDSDEARHLRIGLSLVNDRLFIRTQSSNVLGEEEIPRIAYVPSFAGISAKESRYTPAMIRRFMGQGLPGAVLRNVILDLYLDNERKRAVERQETGSSKLKSSFLRSLRQNDPYEQLQSLLQSVFSYGIKAKEFSDIYHTYITIQTYKGEIRKGRFQRVRNYSPRDLMVEGSGFLQWLTVLSLTLNPSINMVLLDEPDAHLHPALQEELLRELREVTERLNKQVIYSTHSSELIKHEDYTRILDANRTSPKYLGNRDQKIPLLAGIGSEYTPRLVDVEKHKRILFVENESDEVFLRILSDILEVPLPKTYVIWPWASGHKERKYVHLELKKMIPELVSLSLVDRDFQTINSTGLDLKDKSYGADAGGFLTRKWRRRHIECYLLHPDAIARASGCTPQNVIDHIASRHALDISGRIVDQSEPELLLQANGKDILEEHPQSIKAIFGSGKFDIAKAMIKGEVPLDIRKLIDEIRAVL
ncbi:ATP-dependent nuclease [Mariprofundus ferrooxydans]|uniref:ATP-dependent nuclease n=1 Tax=Mariprofundus ferrooxydans TaxID=314344 RepID=UPI001430D2FA|nr:AAA family ATPase [Mariprofundus ferrooxydans]